MDPKNNLDPLLSVQLTLNEEDMAIYCEPPLDNTMDGCFSNMISEIIEDIVNMAKLIDRISDDEQPHYLVRCFLIYFYLFISKWQFCLFYYKQIYMIINESHDYFRKISKVMKT